MIIDIVKADHIRTDGEVKRNETELLVGTLYAESNRLTSADFLCLQHESKVGDISGNLFRLTRREAEKKAEQRSCKNGIYDKFLHGCAILEIDPQSRRKART